MPVARGWIVLALVATVVVTVALAAATTVTVAQMTCGGDGGEPFSADVSMAGRFCRSGLAWPYFVVQAAGPVLGVLVLGSIAAVRRSWRELVVGVALAATVLVLMAGGVVAMTDRCSDERAARDPEGCRTY